MNLSKKSDYKKGGRDYYSRRIGKDGSKLSTDIHVYRWFWCFLKLTKELEDKKEKLEINNKSYDVKIDRSHNWFKLINIDRFSKSKNINTKEITKFYGKVKKLFNQDFFPKYRHLFLEPTSKEINSLDELYKILEEQIIPMYYDNKDTWREITQNGMRDVRFQFDSNRMAEEYYEKMYKVD